MYIRVKDPTSGHQFDRPEGDPLIEEGLLIPLNSEQWPPAEQARPPKFAITPPPKKAAPTVSGAEVAAGSPESTESKEKTR